MIGDNKWIYFDNPKRGKLGVSPSQPSTSTSKKNIHRPKTLFCMVRLRKYFELLRPHEIITADYYQRQLYQLSNKLMQKRPSVANNQRKVILLRDNTRPYVAESVKQTLL